MARMKYVNFGEFGIVVFEEQIEHNAMVRLIGKDAVSAGFVSADPDCITCFGESVSLKLKCTLKDTERLQRQFRGY